MDSRLFTTVIKSLYRYMGIPLCIFGNLGNILCALIFFQRSWRKNVCVFYFLSCLLFDTIYINVSLFGLILILGFQIDLTSSNVVLCKIYNYFSYLLVRLSPTILILASIDRLLISSQNVDTRLYSSKRLAYLLTSTSTIFWSIFFFHVLIKFDIQRAGIFASICFFDTTDMYANFFAYSLSIINILSFLAMIILSKLSFENVRRIRSIPRQQRQTTRMMHKKDFQLLRCLYARDILYIICTALLSIYSIYRFIPKSGMETDWQKQFDLFIFNLATFIRHVPSCLGLYIYIVFSKAFRQSCKRSIWKMLGKDFSDTQEMGQEEQNLQTIRREMKESMAISTIML